jgi:hypothetical protein
MSTGDCASRFIKQLLNRDPATMRQRNNQHLFYFLDHTCNRSLLVQIEKKKTAVALMLIVLQTDLCHLSGNVPG